MEKIRGTDRTRSEVLHRVQWKGILHTVTGREANWIGHNWRRNCLLKHVIEGKIERRSKWKTGKKKWAAIE